MADINGVERTYANKDEYDWEGGEADSGPDFDTYTVKVKWTGTIASFNIKVFIHFLIKVSYITCIYC